jgi:hypothetical protein
LSALLRWTRERYPNEYRSYSIIAGGTGRECMERLWAEYLKWKEK